MLLSMLLREHRLASLLPRLYVPGGAGGVGEDFSLPGAGSIGACSIGAGVSDMGGDPEGPASGIGASELGISGTGASSFF